MHRAMSEAQARPRILVAAEVRARELKARLYVAARMRTRGFPVSIGRQQEVRRRPERFAPSVIVINDVSAANAQFAHRARALGHRLVAWDEESIAVLGDDWYARQRVDPDTLQAFDHLFTRGRGDAAAIARRCPPLADRVVPAGNPRIDILHPSVYGKLSSPAADAPIVAMSRFSRSNPFEISREKTVDNLQCKYRLDRSEMPFVEGYLNHCHVLFDRFLPMVGSLAKRFAARSVVVRPHPSERFETWHALARAHPNLSVATDGTAVDLAARSALVIHNGCTTGLEAALIGRPVLAFTPVISPTFDVALPNAVSTCCGSEEALFETVAQTLDAPADAGARSARVWRFLRDGWVGDGSGRLASDIIVDVLDRSYTRPLPPVRGRAAALAGSHAAGAKDWLKRKSRKFYKSDSARTAYHNQKFGETSTEDIARTLGELGFADMRVTAQSPFWWRLDIE